MNRERTSRTLVNPEPLDATAIYDLKLLEARVRIELTNKGFADLKPSPKSSGFEHRSERAISIFVFLVKMVMFVGRF